MAEAETKTPETNNRKHYDHTEGSVVSSILRMGLPTMLGFGAAYAYDLVDMFWLAKLGKNSVAAVTIFFAFYWVISSANQIAGSGSVAIISRRFGEKDMPATAAAIKEAILLKLLLALLFGIPGLLILRPVLGMIGAEGEVWDLAETYGRILLLGLGVNFASFTIYTALRGVGDPNKAMTLQIAGVVLNMALDPLLIFGWGIFPELGIAGAAWASIIAYGITFLIGLGIFYGGFTTLRLYVKGRAPVQLANMWKIMRIGFPSGINSISFSVSRLVVMPMIAMYGTNVVAAFGMAQRVTALGILIIVGLGLGISALIGQNLGAGKPERVRKISNISVIFSTAVMSLFGLITILCARPIAGIFFEEPELMEHSIVALRILSLGLPLIGIHITLEMCCSGAGENTMPMVFSIIGAWCLQVPMVFVVTKLMHWQAHMVWWAFFISGIIGCSIFFTYFRRGTWMLKKV
ncbi:MAG: MATE family efflux transporter [bacterium]|nr:MATE family efflux transporter [bacterium]